MSSNEISRPSLAEYPHWLEEKWDGDKRELRKGRFLHQQGDLLRAFQESAFFIGMLRQIEEWADGYHAETGFQLFSTPRPNPELRLKQWESFLSRTRRENAINNAFWPQPPKGGWFLPDNWFERLWDIVRTRYVVRYLDGVEWLSKKLEDHAGECGCTVRRVTHAQDRGYYAMHVLVGQTFTVQALDLDDEETRTSEVEIQITTELQEVIGQLTHRHFERRRESAPASKSEQKWQWDYQSPEFTPYYLGHLLHYLEGMIMRIRTEPSDPE